MAERPEDLNLPNAVITRIIKEALPDGVNISKEARSAISRAASVFVLYATSCANNFAMKGKRKTLNASDVLSAMEEMEFQRFVAPLKESLEGIVLSSCRGSLITTKSCFPRTLDKQHLLACLVSLLFAQHPTLQFAWGINNVHLNRTGITLFHN
ncbi:PREDICTED: DNA polymerase epsilon subunit 3 isoform X1 [Haliaeetus leucocephalus]|uniref:DNA polymerase epsilon subunit 3 isoform X1 n=1 Tax=Haliaeetus leucocephalus TaxID=52644 RepID=UPI00053CDAB5|nr:PREDICTED: DNA polymerase epsilon subunit 3 isoform X1 [Haliaeetus leucocephalus]